MALNLTNLFQVLGRVGRNAFTINQCQDLQPATFDSLVGYSYLNPAWTTGLVQLYDSLIRNESTGMSSWTSNAQTILQALVYQEEPTYGTNLSAALQYVYLQMLAQSETVQLCTITSVVTAEPENIGEPVVFVILTRGDGILYQNVVPEVGTLIYTADSYTSGAVAGQEPWTWLGTPNLSSLETGVPVGLWDWDWPQGSNSSASGANISAAQQSNPSSNYLYNGNFVYFDDTDLPLGWHLSVGTWGVSIARIATKGLDGGYAIRFYEAGSILNTLTQQFNSTETDPLEDSAGTSAALTPYRGYAFNFWLAAATSGTLTGGVITVSLVDDNDTVINDQQGTANTFVIPLTGLTDDYVAYSCAFRLPVVTPSVVQLKIAVTTAITGADLYMDWICFCTPVNTYTGGPSIAVFSDPRTPIEAGPDPDAFQIEFTNDYGGSQYKATWQTLFNRLFQAPGLILPYSATPTIADSLISSPEVFTPSVFNLFPPEDLAATDSGASFDANGLPLVMQFVQALGVVSGASSVIGTIEESSTGVGAWTTVAGGTFTDSIATGNIQVLVVYRTKRYLRYTCTIVGGGASVLVSCTGGYDQ